MCQQRHRAATPTKPAAKKNMNSEVHRGLLGRVANARAVQGGGLHAFKANKLLAPARLQ
jgi:hypothetical protein